MKQCVVFFSLIWIFSLAVSAQTSIYTTKACTTSVNLNEVKVEIRNYKNIKNFADFYCRGKIVIFKQQQPVDSIQFDKMNQTGNYGLFLHHDIVPEHVLISKFGNDENKTILINNSGSFFILIGNAISIDTSKKVLIVFNTDYPEELTLFDYEQDTIIQKFEHLDFEPCQVVTDSKGKYYLRSCSNKETSSYYLMNIKDHSLKKVKLKKVTLSPQIQIVSDPKENKIKCQCDCEYLQP